MNKVFRNRLLACLMSTALAIPFALGAGVGAFAENGKATVDFTKVDESSKPLKGAVIEVFKEGDNGTLTKQLDITTDDKGMPIAQKNAFFKDGKLQLDIGSTYQFLEKTAPSGYMINRNPDFPLTVFEGENKVSMVDKKLDKSNGQLVITLYKNNKFYATDIEIHKFDNKKPNNIGELIFKAQTSDKDGGIGTVTKGNDIMIDGTLALIPGKYFITDLKAKRMFSFTINGGQIFIINELQGGTSTEPVKPKPTKPDNIPVITNPTANGDTLLSLTASTKDNDRIANAVIEVYQTKNKILFKGKTSTDGNFYAGGATTGASLLDKEGNIKLAAGKYYYRVTASPSGFYASPEIGELNIKGGEKTSAIINFVKGKKPASIGTSSGRISGSSTRLAKTGMAIPTTPLFVAGAAMVSAGAVMLKRKK